MAADRTSGPVILFIGYGQIPNGFARVLEGMLQALHHAWPEADLHHFAINLPAPAPRPIPWQMHANPDGPEEDTSLTACVRAVAPDIIVFFDTPQACAKRLAAIVSISRARTVCYCALDDEDSLNPGVLQTLAQADALVVFTKFAQQLLASSFSRADHQAPPIGIIPHGIDTVFSELVSGDPAASRDQARRELWPQEPSLANAFIVLNANRNQPFKRLDITLSGFALFAQDKPSSVKLCLHTASRSAAAGETALADRLGIRQRLLTTAPGPSHPDVDNQRLNAIYNACDVGINTSQREAWGLISFEHGAVMRPQLVPGHTACAELWRSSALLLDTAPASGHAPAFIRHTVTATSVARSLEQLYQDNAEYEYWSASAHANARRPEFQWPSIAGQWKSLFHHLLPQTRRHLNAASHSPSYSAENVAANT